MGQPEGLPLATKPAFSCFSLVLFYFILFQWEKTQMSRAGCSSAP